MAFKPNTLERIESYGGYQIIYCDPAWSYSNQGRGAATKHYGTTPDAKLAALPVSRLAAKNAVMFMWGTWPTLPVNLATMQAWGFEYKTLGFLWVKTNTKSGSPFWGGGFWTRSNSEFCLLGVRGDLRRIDAGVHQLVDEWEEQGDLVLRAPVSKHSAKPPEVRDRIIRLMGDLPAIELFARCTDENDNIIENGRVHVLFDQWGNQCQSDVDLNNETNPIDAHESADVPVFSKHEPIDESIYEDERNTAAPTDRDEISPERNTAASTDVDTNRNKTTNEIQIQNDEQIEDGDLDKMAQIPKDMADEIGAARTAGGGNWIQHGSYILMIHNWFYQKIQDRCIICELEVIEAHKKIVFEGAKEIDVSPNPPGSDVSEVANFDGAGKQSAQGNSRAVALGLFGFKENEVPNDKISATMSDVTSDAQPAAGMLIGCSTFSKEKRTNKGEYITGRNWSCVSKPGEGVNAPHLVAERVAARKISADQALLVTQKHLAAYRSAGGIASAPVDPAAAAPSVPAVPGVPAAPAVPPPAPPVVAPPAPPVDLLAGWVPNPQNEAYWYRIVNGAAEQKLKTDIMAGR